MKLKILIVPIVAVFTILSFSNSVFASNWAEGTGTGVMNWISIASSSDGTNVAAVANDGGFQNPGYVYTSTDSGATWTVQTGSGSRVWKGIASSSDGLKLAAVDPAITGYLYTSTNGGEDWTRQDNAGDRAWYDIASSSDGTKLVAVVYSGFIYTSTDSGATWTAQTDAGSRLWRSVASSSDGTNLVAVVQEGLIYTSTNSGATWTAQTDAGSRLWTGVTSSSDGLKLVATVGGGSNSYIYTSTDGGSTWTGRSVAGNKTWADIASSSDGTKLIAAAGGDGGDIEYVYISTDSGATWTAQTDAGARYWHTVASSADGLNMFAGVGNAGSGSIWVYTTPDTTSPTITSVTPLDGAIDQDSATTVVINFSEPMDTTVSEAEVAFSPCTSCSLTSAWSNSDQTLTLTKTSGTFTAGQAYTFTVTAPEDVAGNPMAEPYEWSFTILSNAVNNNYQFPPLCTTQFSSSTITKGDPTTLSWSISWPIDEPHKKSTYYVKVPTMGIFGPNEPKAILYPTHTTTYRLAAINLFGANFCEATITVLDTDGTEIVSTQNSYLTANSIRSPLGSMIVDFLRKIFSRKQI